MFEFKKWGNGSSCYDVIVKTSYNPLSKTFKYKSLGMVEKQGKEWVTFTKPQMKAKTRKELAEKMAYIL
jgi:hypothetical protein